MVVFLGQLVGVVDIVPDAIESACYAAQWIHKGVSAPDGEDGVLLSQSLCGTDDLVLGIVSDVPSHPFAEGELYDARQQAARCDGYLWQYAVASHQAVVHVLGADGNGNGECRHPQVECRVGNAA